MNPSSIRSILSEFESHDSVGIDGRVDAHCVRVVKSECGVEILLPHNCHEWFVTVFEPSTDEQITHDWMEHYSTDSELTADIELEMRTEVENFLSAVILNRTKLKTKQSKTWWFKKAKTRFLQYETKSGWQTIVPFPTTG